MPQIYAYAQESANESNSDDKTFAMSTFVHLYLSVSRPLVFTFLPKKGIV